MIKFVLVKVPKGHHNLFCQIGQAFKTFTIFWKKKAFYWASVVRAGGYLGR